MHGVDRHPRFSDPITDTLLRPDGELAQAALGEASDERLAFKRDALQFPLIQGGLIRACCGDLATFGKNELVLGPRISPDAGDARRLADMVAIARGLVVTHALEGALGRPGV